MAEQQNYKNHSRFFPLFHFVAFPILAINFIWQIVRFFQEYSWDRVELILLAFGLIVLALTARLQALKTQDRVIRLEEKLRYEKLLSPELAARAANFSVSQIIALRFASDGELADLTKRTANGEFNDNKSIKQAIKDWKADNHRV